MKGIFCASPSHLHASKAFSDCILVLIKKYKCLLTREIMHKAAIVIEYMLKKRGIVYVSERRH